MTTPPTRTRPVCLCGRPVWTASTTNQCFPCSPPTATPVPAPVSTTDAIINEIRCRPHPTMVATLVELYGHGVKAILRQLRRDRQVRLIANGSSLYDHASLYFNDTMHGVVTQDQINTFKTMCIEGEGETYTMVEITTPEKPVVLRIDDAPRRGYNKTGGEKSPTAGHHPANPTRSTTMTTTYRELQQRAKSAGIKANGTRQALELALAAHDAKYHSEPQPLHDAHVVAAADAQPEQDAYVLAYCEAQVELAAELAAMADPMYDFTTGAADDRDALAELIADGTLAPAGVTMEAPMSTTTTTQEQPMNETTTTDATRCVALIRNSTDYATVAAMRAAHFNSAMQAHAAVMAERLSQPQTDVVFSLPKTSRLDPRNLVNRIGRGGLTVTVDEVAQDAVEDHDAHVRAHKLSQSLYMGWAVDVASKGQIQVATQETKADVKRAEAHVRAAIAALRHAGYCDDHAVVADLERLVLCLSQCEGFQLPGMVLPTLYRSGSDGVLPQVIRQTQGQVIQVERITASGKVKDPMTGKAARPGSKKCQCGKPVWAPSKTGQCFRCTPNTPTVPVVRAQLVATVRVPVVQVPVTMDRDEAIVVYGTVRPSTTPVNPSQGIPAKAPSSPVAASKPVQAVPTLLPTPRPVLEAARAVASPVTTVTPVAAPIPAVEAAAAVLYRTAGNIRTLQCKCQLAGIPWNPTQAKMTLCRALAAKGITG